MMNKNRVNQSGIAILEASGVLLILLSLLISGFGLIEYMRISRNLSELINKHVTETALKPYSLNTDFSNQNTPRVQLNKIALEKYVDDLSINIGLDLNDYLEKVTANSASAYIIESAFAEIKINTETGVNEGLVKIPHSYNSTKGNQSLQTYMDEDVKLDIKFDDYTKKETNGSENSENGKPSYFAIPNAKFSLGAAGSNYLPSTVLVGVRAGVRLEDTLIGSMLELLGREPFLSEFKVVTLRGEISDEV